MLTIADYEATFEGHKRLVRELDVALSGEAGAARQASLCDLIEPARRLREDHSNLLRAILAEPNGVELANRLTGMVIRARKQTA